MKVAIIIPALKQLGPVKVMQTLVNTLSENNEIQFKVYYLDKEIDPLVNFLAPSERLNRSTFPFTEYDIVHTNGIRPDLFAWFYRKNIKYHISTIHNLVFDDLSYTYNKFISLLFGNIWLQLWKRADKLVCVSETMKNYYQARLDSSKLKVIHNGIPEADKSLETDSDVINIIENCRNKGFKIIGCAGILTKIKGLDQILNALSGAKDYSLVIIGDGKERANLQKLAQKLKISDRCHFCGFRSSAVNYFKHFDFFLMPSRSEGFGLALMEAVQQKVPVICSDLPVFKELFNDTEVTFFKLEDINSLKEALQKASVSGAGKAVLAYNRFQKNYTDKLMVKGYLELYKSA